MANNGDSNLTTLQKVTRSLSFKLGGSTKEPVSRNGAKKSVPARKIDADNWLQENKTRPSHQKEVPPGNLRSSSNVGAKASLWSKFADGHKEKQALNPFSDTFDKEKLKSLLCSKDDPNYGKPDKNSASAMRAAAGEAKMRGEICDVCEVIFHNGQKTQEGYAAMQFGELFSIYNRINDKVVGLLIRARKKDLLSFNGEMLYQGKDDEEWIVLTKTINTIRVFFGRDGDIIDGGDIDSDVQENSTKHMLKEERRPSTASLPAKTNENPTSTLIHGSAAIAVATIEVIPDDESSRKDSSTLTSTPPESRKSKLSNKGLRSSFRKLVRPMFKRNNSINSKEETNDEPFTPPDSRRGSWLSVKSISSKNSQRSPVRDNNDPDNDDKEEVQKRWRRVLGVSRAIGRFSVLAKEKNEDTVSINNEE